MGLCGSVALQRLEEGSGSVGLPGCQPLVCVLCAHWDHLGLASSMCRQQSLQMDTNQHCSVTFGLCLSPQMCVLQSWGQQSYRGVWVFFWLLIPEWGSGLCRIDFDSVNPRANINFKLRFYEFHLNVIGTPQCGLMVMYNACLFLTLGGAGGISESPFVSSFCLGIAIFFSGSAVVSKVHLWFILVLDELTARERFASLSLCLLTKASCTIYAARL